MMPGRARELRDLMKQRALTLVAFDEAVEAFELQVVEAAVAVEDTMRNVDEVRVEHLGRLCQVRGVRLSLVSQVRPLLLARIAYALGAALHVQASSIEALPDPAKPLGFVGVSDYEVIDQSLKTLEARFP